MITMMTCACSGDYGRMRRNADRGGSCCRNTGAGSSGSNPCYHDEVMIRSAAETMGGPAWRSAG